MFNKISVSLIATLCLSSSFITVKAMEIESPSHLRRVKLEREERGNKQPHTIGYINEKLGMINPGFDRVKNIRTEDCLACSKVGYEWLNQQLEFPDVAEDIRPTGPNIWLKATGRLLTENDSQKANLKFDCIEEGDLYVYSNPNDQNVIIIPDDDFKAARFAKVKLKENQYKKTIKLEEYIKERFFDPLVEEKQCLAGIIYLECVRKKNNIYIGHFVNFYTVLMDSEYKTYIIDPTCAESLPLDEYIRTYCGPAYSTTPLYRNDIYVWSGEKYQDLQKDKHAAVKNEDLAHKRKRLSDDQDSPNSSNKKNRSNDKPNITSANASEKNSLELDTEEQQIRNDLRGINPNPIPTTGNQFRLPIPQSINSLNGQGHIYGYGQGDGQAQIINPLYTIPINNQFGRKYLQNDNYQKIVNQPTTVSAIYGGMHNNEPWTQSMLAEFAKSEDKKERATAAGAIYGGMHNNEPWAQSMLAAFAKSGNMNERATAGRAINIGIDNNDSWASLKLAAFAKSGNTNEREMAARTHFISICEPQKPPVPLMPSTVPQNQFVPIPSSQNTVLNNQSNTDGYGQVTSSPIQRRFGQLEGLPINNQIVQPDAQDNKVPYSVYLKQQTELEAARQEIERLKRQLTGNVQTNNRLSNGYDR